MISLADKSNIKQRIKSANELKASLESKIEKVKGSPREEEFQIQVDKLNDLIAHLEKELDE